MAQCNVTIYAIGAVHWVHCRCVLCEMPCGCTAPSRTQTDRISTYSLVCVHGTLAASPYDLHGKQVGWKNEHGRRGVATVCMYARRSTALYKLYGALVAWRMMEWRNVDESFALCALHFYMTERVPETAYFYL